MRAPSFIESLKSGQRQLWEAIAGAAEAGLIYIDEENDAVTATNRLLLTYPGLHELLELFAEQWVEGTLRDADTFKNLLRLRETGLARE